MGKPKGSCVHSARLVICLPIIEGKLRPKSLFPSIQAQRVLLQNECKWQSCRWPQQVLTPIALPQGGWPMSRITPFKLGGVEMEPGYWMAMDRSWPTAQGKTDPGNGIARGMEIRPLAFPQMIQQEKRRFGCQGSLLVSNECS